MSIAKAILSWQEQSMAMQGLITICGFNNDLVQCCIVQYFCTKYGHFNWASDTILPGRMAIMSVLLVWKSRVFVRYFYCICIYGHQVIITVDVSEIPAFPDKPWNVQLFPGKPAKLIISSDIKSQINEDNWQATDLVQLVSNRQQLIWHK